MNDLRARREKMGISQCELARRCGLSGACISHIENGVHTPKKDTLQRIESALSNVHVADKIVAVPFKDGKEEDLRQIWREKYVPLRKESWE